MHFFVAIWRHADHIPAHSALLFVGLNAIRILPQARKFSRLHVFCPTRRNNLCRVFLNILAVIAIEPVLPLRLNSTVSHDGRDEFQCIPTTKGIFGRNDGFVFKIMARRRDILVYVHTRQSQKRHHRDDHESTGNICPRIDILTHRLIC